MHVHEMRQLVADNSRVAKVGLARAVLEDPALFSMRS